MNNSDLQIGNYVNYEQTTHKIHEIHTDKVIHCWLDSIDEYVSSYDEISPINISVDILEKFKFERFKKEISFPISLSNSELVDYWEKSYGVADDMGVRSVFIIWTDRKVSHFSMKSLNKLTDKKFHHVHELQQLFKLYSENELVYENK